MEPGDRLYSGHSIWSADGRFALVMQGDGNLVEYGPGGAWWSTMTTGTAGAWFVQQGDGNGVIYNGSSVAVWYNGTMNSGARLVVQNDGNVVTYAGYTALYATNQHRTFGYLRPVDSRNPGVGGNCTWWVYEQMKNYMKRGAYPLWEGNAEYWDTSARNNRWNVQSMPTSHAAVVFDPGTHGMPAEGHVAWATAVQHRPDGVYVHVTEMNINGLWSTRTHLYKHVSGMSYITAPSL